MSALAGRSALVAGASRGLGRAIARALAEAGADLALLARERAPLDDLAAAIRGSGRRAVAIGCDATAADDVARAVAAARDAHGRIDILVAAVGGPGGVSAPTWEIAPDDFRRVLDANLTAAFHLLAAVLPIMIAQRAGRIIAIGGTYGLRGRAGRAAYSAGKWGLRGLVKSAALEAGPYGVTVNCLCPGMVEGPGFEAASAARAAADGIAIEEARERQRAAHPLRRITTEADIAALAVFLAGEGGRQITGQDLAVDGGWSV